MRIALPIPVPTEVSPRPLRAPSLPVPHRSLRVTRRLLACAQRQHLRVQHVATISRIYYNCIYCSMLRSAQLPKLVLLVPPTSEQPEYSMMYRTHIHNLDDDSLLQVFNCYRVEDEDGWYFRLAWLKLAHVCRKWRCLIYDLWSHLDMCLLLTNDFPSTDPPSHFPPLPLVIACPDGTTTIARNGEDNIYLGLQQHDRIRRVVLRASSSSFRMWLEPMNKLFPRLRDLSLLSTTTEGMSLVLPQTFRAPDLRHLTLLGIGLPRGLSLLSSTIALSSLSLTHIGASCYFPPRDLITQLQGLPLLEELSIGFAIPIPLPSRERELLPAPILPVTAPTLRRLTFRGVDVYLDNLVAQINTPRLERLSLTLLFDPTFTLVNLTEFIHRIEGLGCSAALVIFNKDSASIDAGYYEWKLSLHVNCKSLNWQIDSATQVCTAIGKVLSAVQELTLDLDVDGMPLDWERGLNSTPWHELLLPFIGVKKLRIGSPLTLELSRALQSVAGESVLPELRELEVHAWLDLAEKKFFAFIETRNSVGRPVHFSPIPCRLCRALRPRNEVAHLGGFCSERHKWQWEALG